MHLFNILHNWARSYNAIMLFLATLALLVSVASSTGFIRVEIIALWRLGRGLPEAQYSRSDPNLIVRDFFEATGSSEAAILNLEC